MAGVQANPPALREQESAPAEAGDEALAADELECLSLFSGLKKGPSLEKFPGTTFLRKAYPGRIICEQGDKGSTAFYVLTAEDVIALREKQLATIKKVLEAPPDERERLHWYLARQPEEELRELAEEYAAELRQVKESVNQRGELPEDQVAVSRQALTVHVLSEQEQRQLRRGSWAKLLDRLRGRRSTTLPRHARVAADAPVDTDALLYEGDLFGEMSCLNRAPRSATVIAARDCYLLEMLRNVLDQVRRDPEQKERMDEIYRQRVLQGHLEQLSFFADVAPGAGGLERLRDDVELETHEPGDVVFEEHDASDAIYVVRTGLIKIVKNVGCKLRRSEFSADQLLELCGKLAAAGQEKGSLRARIWAELPANVQAIVQSVAARAQSQGEDRTKLLGEVQAFIKAETNHNGHDNWHALLQALNSFICEGSVHRALGKTTDEVLDALDERPSMAVAEGFPEKTENWSGLERRLFHRLFLEAAFEDAVPARAATNAPMQTLAYDGPGAVFGEMGVFLNAPRSATCIAYDHPDGRHDMRIPDARTGARPSQLELVKIPRDTFTALLANHPELKKRVEAIVESRKSRSQRRRKSSEDSQASRLTGTAEFEELGLIQGQMLMLIDLDRCTRCGDCVSACVGAHDDGNTRLYLDGPRFGGDLVPLTCRKCLDPVCMIGCPVASINRGDQGEIIIRDWCIGCGLCADQCPYGSIQMTPLDHRIELTQRQQEMLPIDTSVKEVTYRAVVCDLCSSLTTGPACVYACPHDAAKRVNASQYFAQD